MLVLEGEDVEVDTTVIEQLKDPITHMIRNAVDHGFESTDVRLARGKNAIGTIRVTALHQSGGDVFEEHVRRLDVGALRSARERFECEEHRLATGDLEDRLEENRKTARPEDVVEQRAALHDAAPIRRCTVAAISGSGVGLGRNASAPRACALRWISGEVCAVRMITRVPRE